jgi:inner membrane protein
MDNVTHSLTGLALSRAGLDRFSPKSVWLLILSANAPDIDIAAAPQGAFRYLQIHRGYTHSLLGLPIMALMVVLVVAGASRQKLPWLRAWLLCVAGLASHLLLDWTNSYGVRFFLPFSSRWFHLDWNSLYDISILLVLAFATIWPIFSRLVTREIGERRGSTGRAVAIFALTFFLLFDLGRAILHNRVVSQLNSRLYDGAPPQQAAALPDAFSPFEWTSVVETTGNYQLSRVHALSQPDPADAVTFYKPAQSRSLENARSIDPFRYFLYFARFPVWSLQPVINERSRGTRLDLTDLRFGIPGGGSFHCIGYENEQGELVEKTFTYGSGRDLGWNGTRTDLSER